MMNIFQKRAKEFKLIFMVTVSVMAMTSSFIPILVMAQTTPPEPPFPSYRNIDANGVEVGWGGVFKEIKTHSSIGPIGEGGLSRIFYSMMDSPSDETQFGSGSADRDNYFGAVYEASSTSIDAIGFNWGYSRIKIGDKTEVFSFGYVSQYLFPPDSYHGQKLISNSSLTEYTYQDSNGVIYNFSSSVQNASCNPTLVGSNTCAFLTSIKKPDGEIIRIIYQDANISDCNAQLCTPKIKYVSNNYGYVLKYLYTGKVVTQIVASNKSYEYCDITSNQCALDNKWQKWNYLPAPSGVIGAWWARTSIDPLGHQTSYTGVTVAYPSGVYKKIERPYPVPSLTFTNNNTKPVDYYLIKPEGTWKYSKLFDNVQQSCEPQDMPSGFGVFDCYLFGTGPYNLVTDPYGNSTKFKYSSLAGSWDLPNGSIFYPIAPTQAPYYYHWYLVGQNNVFQNLNEIIDPLNRSYKYQYLNRAPVDNGMLLSIYGTGPTAIFPDLPYFQAPELVTSPTGATVTYEYDLRLNVTKKTFTSVDGATTIVIQWGFDQNCSNQITCNKPNFVIDAKGNRTDYTYDPAHGGVLTETGPADVNGVRPQIRYSYSQLYAKVLDASGVLVNAEAPIWKLTGTSTCRTATAANPASCVGTVNEIVKTFAYISNNLLLSSETNAAGDRSASQTVTYGYDDYGNRISIDGPRTDVDDKTYTTYDILRRPIYEISVDPDGSGPLKRAAVRHNYDVDGNEWKTESGTCDTVTFNGAIPTGCVTFTVANFKRNTYDSTTGYLVKTEVVQP